MHKGFTLFCRVSARLGIAKGTQTYPHSQDRNPATASTALKTLHMAQQHLTLQDPYPQNDNSKLQSDAIKSSLACKPLAESRQES